VDHFLEVTTVACIDARHSELGQHAPGSLCFAPAWQLLPVLGDCAAAPALGAGGTAYAHLGRVFVQSAAGQIQVQAPHTRVTKSLHFTVAHVIRGVACAPAPTERGLFCRDSLLLSQSVAHLFRIPALLAKVLGHPLTVLASYVEQFN
jgi:hypothetical protein